MFLGLKNLSYFEPFFRGFSPESELPQRTNMADNFIGAEEPVTRHRAESDRFPRALDCKPSILLNDRKVVTEFLRPKRIFVGTSGDEGELVFVFPLIDHTVACHKGQVSLLSTKCIYSPDWTVGHVSQYLQREVAWQVTAQPFPMVCTCRSAQTLPATI